MVKTNILKHSALEDALRREKAPASFLSSGSLLLLSATATIFSSPDHFLPPAPPGPALVRLLRPPAGPAQDFAPPVPHHQPNTSDFCAWLFRPKFYRGGKSPKLQELSPPVADPSVRGCGARRVRSLAKPSVATFCRTSHHWKLTSITSRPPRFAESGAGHVSEQRPSQTVGKRWLGVGGGKKAANHGGVGASPAPSRPQKNLRRRKKECWWWCAEGGGPQ